MAMRWRIVRGEPQVRIFESNEWTKAVIIRRAAYAWEFITPFGEGVRTTLGQARTAVFQSLGRGVVMRGDSITQPKETKHAK